MVVSTIAALVGLFHKRHPWLVTNVISVGGKVLESDMSSRRMFIVNNDGDIVEIWNGVVKSVDPRWKNSGPVALNLSKNEQLLAIGLISGELVILDLFNNVVRKRWIAHESGVASVKFVGDDRIISTGNRDSNLKIWTIADAELLGSMKAPAEISSQPCLSSDGQSIYVVSFSESNKSLTHSTIVAFSLVQYIEKWRFQIDNEKMNFTTLVEKNGLIVGGYRSRTESGEGGIYVTDKLRQSKSIIPLSTGILITKSPEHMNNCVVLLNEGGSIEIVDIVAHTADRIMDDEDRRFCDIAVSRNFSRIVGLTGDNLVVFDKVRSEGLLGILLCPEALLLVGMWLCYGCIRFAKYLKCRGSTN